MRSAVTATTGYRRARPWHSPLAHTASMHALVGGRRVRQRSRPTCAAPVTGLDTARLTVQSPIGRTRAQTRPLFALWHQKERSSSDVSGSRSVMRRLYNTRPRCRGRWSIPCAISPNTVAETIVWTVPSWSALPIRSRPSASRSGSSVSDGQVSIRAIARAGRRHG